MPGLSNQSVARGSAYELIKGMLANTASNVPANIALIAEVNTANQSADITPRWITSRGEAATLWGWGSPIDQALRILLPANGGGLNGGRIKVFPQLEAGSAAANSQSITVTGTATAAATHTLLVAGRSFLEGGSYEFTIASGDTPTAIAAKIVVAINAVLGSPVSATSALGVVTTVAVWKGLSSQAITLNILTNGVTAGVSYAVAEVAAGVATPDISTQLALFENDWFPIVITGQSISNTGNNAKINTFNGNINSQTGQWNRLVMRPGVYLAGNVVDSTASSADTVITDALKTEMSISSASTPKSLGLPIEGAANYALRFSNVSNNTPNIDIQANPLPDMPGLLPTATVPTQNNSYSLRNTLVLKGMSTAIYKDGQFYPQDFVTTYHPVGETPPAFNYPRDLVIDMNVYYKFSLVQKAVMENKQVAADNDEVTAANVVKPKDMKAALVALAKDLVSQGFLTDAAFMIKSIKVTINATNRNRFDTEFNYERSGVTRVMSNVATVFP